MALKLLGYNLLGSFRFNINNFAIPLGFFVFLAFFRPKLNLRSKQLAAVLGLLFFIVGVAQPVVDNYFYQIPIQVKTTAANLYDINFQDEWKLLQQQLKLSDDVRLEDFYAGFDSDGSIRELRFNLVCQKNNGFVYYNVNLAKNKKVYVIRRTKMEQWLQYTQSVTAQRFFEIASNLKINLLKPKQEYSWYSIASQGVLVNYDIENHEKYIIDFNGEVTQVKNEQLPIKGYLISIYGMHKMNEVSYEGQGYQDYLFDVIQNKKSGLY